jgi:hypothetical protein
MRLNFGLSLSVVLLVMAAGCRDVLGIHAPSGDSDTDTSIDPDAGQHSGGVRGGNSGAGSGMDVAGEGGGTGGRRGVLGPRAGQAGTAAGSGGRGDAGAVSGGNGGSGGTAGMSGTTGGAGQSAGDGGAGGTSGTGGPLCVDACDAGDLQCASSTELQACEIVNGCGAWTTITPCHEHQLCSPSGTSAVCTCKPAPQGCTRAGPFCASSTRIETCVEDEEGCLSQGAVTSCPAGKPCSGDAGSAECSCPAAPAVCMGETSGDVCQSDTSYARCAMDSNGCVVATAGTCDPLKPCRGEPGDADCTCLNPPTTPQCPGNQRDGTRCSGSTLLRCGTDGAGCLRFAQTECASGVCRGSYPNAECIEERSVGFATDLGGTQPQITGGLAGIRITLPAPAVIRRFGIISRTTGTHAIMVLYDEQDDQPRNRIAATANSALVAGVNEYPVGFPPAEVLLSAGSYWLMVSVDASTQLAYGTRPVSLAYLSYTHGSPIPSPLTVVAFDETPELNLYIVVLPQ